MEEPHAQSHHHCLRNLCRRWRKCALGQFDPSSSHAAATAMPSIQDLNLKTDAASLPDRTFKEGY